MGEAPIEVYEDMSHMNLRTAILMSSNVLGGMRQRNFGRIIFVAAKPALVPSAGWGAYAIAKGGIVSLTTTVAEELVGTGVTANAIAPSVILTDANRASMPGADAGKWVTPGEIAELALFFCSRHARSINGNVVKIYAGVSRTIGRDLSTFQANMDRSFVFGGRSGASCSCLSIRTKGIPS